MKQEKKREQEFEELYETLNQVTEEYQEYFKALAALPSVDPSYVVVPGNTTTPYGDPDNNAGSE